MSQSGRQDLEQGNDTNGLPQPIQNPPLWSNQGGINYGDMSWPLYAMYSKVAQEEDNKKAERVQNALDGILVFSGLFSATIAALLAVTIPDLKPSSQDASAFYLENIYQLFANQNTSNGLTPSILSKPPAFSPPKYVVWVNSLWTMALLISLMGTVMTTLAQREALHYLIHTQNEEHSPETRARLHAKCASAYEVFTPRGECPEHFFLHISLFLFLAGLLIYFFNINHATFAAVVWLIAIITMLYTYLTVYPFLSSGTLSATPFSPMALWVYLGVLYAMVRVFSWIKPLRGLSIKTKKYHRDLSNRYRVGIVEGYAKSLKEAASMPSSAIDAKVVERILLVLADDHALETFFDAVPGFCRSKLVQPLYPRVTTKLKQSLDGFLDRTFSSRLVPESVRNNRLITCLNAAHSALGSFRASQILDTFFHRHRDEALKSVELGNSLIRWGHTIDGSINPIIRRIVACIIAHAHWQDRDSRWSKLVMDAFDIPDGVIRDYVARGDSMLLAILNHVARKALRIGRLEPRVLESLSQFDIQNTAAELRNEFCALWNEIVQEARDEGFDSFPTRILTVIRHLFITLHQGTNAAPNQSYAFFGSIDDFDDTLSRTSSYPLCDIPCHHPDSTAQGPAISPPTIPPPQFRIRSHSDPVIGASTVQRPQSSLRLRRTQSCSHLPPVTLPTRPGYPSISSPRPALVTVPPLTNSPDVVTEDAMPDFADNSVISGTADAIRGSSSSSGPSVQQVEETRTTSASVVLGTLPTPLLTPALSHSAISAMLPSSINHAPTQTHFLHHPPGPPTLITMHLSASLQVTTAPNQNTIPGGDREQENIQDSRHLTPRTRMDQGQPPPGGPTVL